MTGVWWDLNTCPVPHGFDPRNVRRCIETAFRKMFGERRRVTICAIGNLEYVSPQVLEAISSSGILIKHAVFGGKGMCWLLFDWSSRTPPPAKILLISSNPSWLTPALVPSGYTVLRAFPKNCYQPPFYIPNGGECDWETLLNDNLEESLEDEYVYGPAWSCLICEIDSFESCISFVNHLKSAEHKQNLFDSVPLDENGDPELLCTLCDYPGYDDNNMGIHYNSAQHKQKEKENLWLQETMTGGPLTGVWWDLNTCPVPRGFDPRNVRRCIETSFRKLFGEPRRVTICALGNLEYVSPQVLEAISSSGILIKHAVFGGIDMCWLLYDWSRHTRPPAKILLISSNPSWFTPALVPSGYTVLRAFPENYQPPPFYIPSGGECDWETLLKDNLEDNLEESLEDEYVYGPAWSCLICEIDSFESCISFVNHLKSAEHKQNLFRSVRLDENGVPVLLCTLCDYPGIDDDNMDIHYNSAQHKQKEEEKEKKKRIGEPSLNEANKKKK